MITTFYPPYSFGGDGIFVQQLSHELAKRGHQVEVIHCIDSYRLLVRQEPTGTEAAQANVTVHGLKSPVGFLSPLATQQTGVPLFKAAQIRQILAKGFDVIHYHNISLVGGPKVLEYGQAIKLYTMHEYWLICPTHVLFKFNREPCVRPHCFLCNLIYKRPPPWWRSSGLLEAAIQHVDRFISPSQFGREMHLRMGLKIPIVHLPNFVPLAEASSSTEPPSQSRQPEPYFLFVGRLEKLKGVQTLIPLFRRYPQAQLLVVGQGSDERHLQQLAEGSVNIRFLGYQSGQHLRDLYRQAVAVIVPSLCFELFPLVILEAFREKTPVVVRSLGGLPEIVHESGGGFVYDTEEELMAAMDRLVADSFYRRELGQRGYEAYLRNWTPEIHVQRYLALISEIAATRAQPPG
jgi:glycosyltransferase involved in cell wall biosynthesis